MFSTLKQRALVLGVVLLLAVLLLIPSVFRDQLGKDWPLAKPLALGLDLSGGVHLVYEVVTDEAVKSYIQSVGNGIRAALRKENVAVWRAKALDGNTLEVVLVSAVHKDKARKIIDEQYKTLQFKEEGNDNGKPRILFTLPQEQAVTVGVRAIQQAVETLRNRIDQFGVAEPLIQKVGTNKILLQMPGYKDIEKVKKVVGSVAKLEFRLVPVGQSQAATTLKNRQGDQVKVEDSVLMTGEAVDNATFEISRGQVEVLLSLNSEGAKLFRQITSENVGRELAIILDNVVYSAPRINEAIPNGRASISGVDLEEARNLSVVLKAGALPAPLKVVEERTVGPTLGRESIVRGVQAIIGGFVAIALFMFWYYRKSGLVAVASLALNLVLLLAILAFFGATLTLPGLAGLALTVGIAVDSNVIIFERIRDEIRAGASRDAAVTAGFDKAYSAILDTNVTGLVSALILYIFGTGMIRGFAVVLGGGVITTLFCAVFAARIAFDYFELNGKANGLSI